VIFPDVPPVGTGTVRLVVVAEVAQLVMLLNVSLSRLGLLSKFVPLMPTGNPGAPTIGVNDVIVGVPGSATVNESLLEAEPAALETPIGPVMAPAGTVATSDVVVAEFTAVERPLNVTVFAPGAEEKPVPKIVTCVPGRPVLGENSMTDTPEEFRREMDNRLPTAS
jgi:hypothetical protein